MPRRKSKTIKIEVKIAIAGLIVSIVACTAAVFVVPEVRVWLGLDNNQNDQVSNQSSLKFDEDDLWTIFPMNVGTTWTYNYSKFLESDTPITPTSNPDFGHFSLTVTIIDTTLSESIKVIGIKVSGENYLNFCANHGEKFYTGDLQTWYVLDKKSMYFTCTRQEAYSIAYSRLANPENFLVSSSILPVYRTPIKVGGLWLAWANLTPRQDTSYQWYVESKENLNLPIGEIKDCFRLVLKTVGDTQVRWLCPGIGLVAEEYHHHGAINDYRFELQNFNVFLP